jgi:hypothetical protein
MPCGHELFSVRYHTEFMMLYFVCNFVEVDVPWGMIHAAGVLYQLLKT